MFSRALNTGFTRRSRIYLSPRFLINWIRRSVLPNGYLAYRIKLWPLWPVPRLEETRSESSPQLTTRLILICRFPPRPKEKTSKRNTTAGRKTEKTVQKRRWNTTILMNGKKKLVGASMSLMIALPQYAVRERMLLLRPMFPGVNSQLYVLWTGFYLSAESNTELLQFRFIKLCNSVV